MNIRERILTVYRGGTPDIVPCMLDLSHWFYHKNRMPWDLSVAFEKPEYDLIEYHRRREVGFYIPNLASFYSSAYGPEVKAETVKVERDGVPEIAWSLTTPLGRVERRRIWEPDSYSWAISKWGVETENDLAILGQALASRRFAPKWENYRAWQAAVGDLGVVYISPGYSAMGHLLNYWMGVTNTMYAAVDMPGALHAFVDSVNANILECIDLLASSPAEVVIMGDNFSSDLQPPSFFNEWSRPFYTEAIRRLHAAGKYVAVHVDGMLRNAIAMIRDTGADCCDAVTPTPMGDLTPQACRDEAGPDFILSGGVPPTLWLPGASLSEFKRSAMDWLELKKRGPWLIANAGDQVPPFAVEDRVACLRDLVEKHGRF